MKRIGLRSLLGFFVIVLITNIWPVKPIIDMIDEDHYSYSTADGAFTFTEGWKGYDTSLMFRRLADFRKNSPAGKEVVLYRLFRKNPLQFWRWWEYFTDPRYRFPYKERAH